MAQSYDLHVKRIYEPPSPDDGARVLVDRVWPRGVRKEAAQLTLWLKDIAPSSALRKWFGHDPLLWGEFRRRYRVELDANRAAVERLDRCIKSGRTTLLFAARDTEHNQALVLADYMKARRH